MKSSDGHGMNETSDQGISFGRRIAELAAAHPDRPAIIFAPRSGPPERVLTWRDLDRDSNRVARLLEARGLGQGRMLVVALHNCPEHMVATIAGWKLGACVLPLSPSLPTRERDQLLEISAPAIAVGEWADLPELPLVRLEELRSLDGYSDAPLPDRVSHPGKAIGTGGSTGRSKVIIEPNPWVKVPGHAIGDLGDVVGFRPGQVQLCMTRLYHNMPYSWGHSGLFDGHTIVLMEHFDPDYAVDLIERYRVQFIQTVPICMQRIARLPDIARRDFSSVESVFHSGAPCPPWVKRAWIDLVGAEKLWEGFGGAEATGGTMIRGDDWLAHPGTVGTAFHCEVRILDEDLRELPLGVVGEIFTRLLVQRPTFEYIGSPPPKNTSDGFVSLGDLGWLDDQGYLHHADRRVDLIITGGANVYPAEVEAALTEHPSVVDLAIIPVADEEWGRRVHAIVQPLDPAHPPSVEELDHHCRERLVSYKCPKSYEFMTELPRDPSGKIRRSALAAERDQGWTAQMLPVKSGH